MQSPPSDMSGILVGPHHISGDGCDNRHSQSKNGAVAPFSVKTLEKSEQFKLSYFMSESGKIGVGGRTTMGGAKKIGGVGRSRVQSLG